MLKKYYLISFFLIFLLADIIYSFVQYYHIEMDGDMSVVIVPIGGYDKVLTDPFGLNVLLKNEHYLAPNRFFAHWSMSKYFKSVPFLLQSFLNPIDSVYASCALAKIIIQFSIVFIIAYYVTGKFNFLDKDFLLVSALITPLFQTWGINQINIINPATTYTFFYALPLLLLMVFFLPFYNKYHQQKEKKISLLLKIFLFLLAFVITLNGPLPPAVILIMSPIIILSYFYSNFKNHSDSSFLKRIINAIASIPKELLFFISFILILSIYSLYIGLNNIENGSPIPLKERYLKLSEGINETLFQNIGFPLLIIMIVANIIILYNNKINIEGKRILSMAKWIGIFSIIYILLLPLGGYRTYRPLIIRNDTIMPVTLALFFLFANTSYLILKYSTLYKPVYTLSIIIFCCIFTFVDKIDFEHNKFEREALEKISKSPDDTVLLPATGTVIAWQIQQYPFWSEPQSELIQLWGITKSKKLYYQR